MFWHVSGLNATMNPLMIRHLVWCTARRLKRRFSPTGYQSILATVEYTPTLRHVRRHRPCPSPHLPFPGCFPLHTLAVVRQSGPRKTPGCSKLDLIFARDTLTHHITRKRHKKKTHIGHDPECIAFTWSEKPSQLQEVAPNVPEAICLPYTQRFTAVMRCRQLVALSSFKNSIQQALKKLRTRNHTTAAAVAPAAWELEPGNRQNPKLRRCGERNARAEVPHN